ncbi:HD domain-containing phosphohydrolase [Candidatus Solirubrobacter pratensis]|uniref:HD domain-containing phosphohydrolase n=1 Tax=Candidatus Solirubrobacter pratensis TaxID=1298857 RepID=UPI00048533E4|nr:HD domain-containing phosphohydrolase [Candidatus Solirubrobacter pratensis]
MGTAARRIARFAFLACGAWLAVHELRVVVFPGTGLGPLDSRFSHDVLLLVAAVAILTRVVLVPRERGPWLLLGGGVLAWTFGEIYYTAVLWSESSPPLPSPADAGYLLFPVLALAGLLGLLRARTRVSATLLVDGVTVALAVAALSAAIVFQTVLAHASGEPLAVATGLAYPLTDLVLLAVGVGALAGTGWRLDRSWALIAAGVLMFWFADSMYLVRTAAGTYESGGWFDAGWWGGLLAIAVAAWQDPPARPRVRPRDDALRLIAAPLAAGAVGVELLVYGCTGDLNALAIGLAAGTLVAVMVRLTLTFRQNVAMLRASRAEAMTDALTGLGNRRALTRDLAVLLPDAGAESPLVLALFDLDGFKTYNDTFGHPAGDALLMRLGANLSAYFDARGRVFRMGGDEFCALFEPLGRDVEALLDGAAMALSEQGEGFFIGCSYGAITLPAEATEPAEALRIADQRMYAQKHSGRRSASRQSKDVLLRALSERSPELGGHGNAVAALAEATARRLGIERDALEVVRHAAELHDVGKVAIPDDILLKEGPLTDEEWSFIRRHPVAGERIIAAAPALGAVAKLVRASHERWDGHGYPDRLGGDDIPLGARIIAVADAYDAMTCGRPYRGAIGAEEAVAELRACAGSQFDAIVVEAFCGALAELAVARSA